MALTYTPAGELGSPCPDFRLPTVDGGIFSRAELLSTKATVILFICNHCPYVKAIEDRLIQLARDWTPKGVTFVAICSNDPTEHPEDSPSELLRRWKDKKYGFPYLIDADQSVARDFGAVCTPDLYVFDSQQKLRYRGRLDDSWRDPKQVRRQELNEALMAIHDGKKVPDLQNPSMGCSIKWKK